MYIGSWAIDDLLTFTVTTHNASTGAQTDADAPPAYRVYEAETGTAILTGTMAKLDDANTTGHYSEELTLSAANGFELGKSYNIYISAAVDSVTGSTTRNFQIGAKVNVSHAGGTAWGSGAITGPSIADGAITSAKAPNLDAAVSTRATAAAVTALSTIFTGITSLAQWLGLIAGKQTGDTTARTELRATGAGSGTFDETTDSLEAVRDFAAPASTALSTSNLPANFAALGINASGHVSRVTLADTVTTLTGHTPQTGDAYAAVTSAVPDSIPADGSRPSVQQAAYMVTQFLVECAISGTTMTIRKPDGSTTLFTVTLDDATTPTSKTRAT
jgi:hypothetical protein